MDLVVGRVVKAHGVTGELVVDVRTDDPDSRFAPGSPCARSRPRRAPNAHYVVDSVREHSGRLLVRLDGVADRDAADALRGTVFRRRLRDLPPIDDPDEFYDHQLEGLAGAHRRRARRRHCHRGAAHRGGGIAVGHAGDAAPKCWCRSSAPSSRRCRWTTRPSRSTRPRVCWSWADAMRIDVVTIFPGYLDPLRQSLPGKAIDAGIIDLRVHDLRRWTHDVHRSVDDSPYGGGPGMVMKAPVWGEALDEICSAGNTSRGADAGGPAVHPSRRPTLERRAASGVRLRAVRGHRPAGDRRCGPPDARRRGVDR